MPVAMWEDDSLKSTINKITTRGADVAAEVALWDLRKAVERKVYPFHLATFIETLRQVHQLPQMQQLNMLRFVERTM